MVRKLLAPVSVDSLGIMARFRSDPGDRTTAIAAVVAVHAALGFALLSGLDAGALQRHAERLATVPITLELPKPPPPPAPSDRAAGDAGAPAKKADPSPVVAPKPAVELPAPSPIVAAPVPATGTANSSGASSAGSGSGAGGSGSGLGGGGAGSGAIVAANARLLGGHRARLPRDLLQAFPADRGSAELLLTIAESGRVTDCAVVQGSGSGAVDQALCAVMTSRSRWAPARDSLGRPVSTRLGYTAIWSKR